MNTGQRMPSLVVGLVSFLVLLHATSCEPRKEPLVYKPNIYIYPEEEMNLQVYLEFPQGGSVITSIPEYGAYWDINVDTSGIIDGSYRYLFYESTQPDEWQRYNGWVVARDSLETFFKENLYLYGFRGIEVDDFIDYWIPRLRSYQYYSIYPQTENEIVPLVNLTFSIKPDNIQRLFYYIFGFDQIPNTLIREPSIGNDFLREGFFALEWGVIL